MIARFLMARVLCGSAITPEIIRCYVEALDERWSRIEDNISSQDDDFLKKDPLCFELVKRVTDVRKPPMPLQRLKRRIQDLRQHSFLENSQNQLSEQREVRHSMG